MGHEGGTFTFIKYTPSLGVNPCRMVAKTITNVNEPISRKERKFVYLRWLYRVPPSDWQNILRKRVCLMGLLDFALFVKILIHTSERRPAASRMKIWHICAGKRAHNTVARRKTKDNSACSKDKGCKVLWTAIYSFEVHLFASGARKHGTKFKPDKKPTEGEQKAPHPKQQGCTN